MYAYGGRVFLQGAFGELRHRLPGMMTLIGLAITVAFVFSLAVTLGYRGMALWWELSTLVAIMLLGHWIEMRSIFQAQGALKELARLLPNIAIRVTGDATEEVAIAELRDDDVVLIRPGASVPADGVVESGTSDVNEAMITGGHGVKASVDGRSCTSAARRCFAASRQRRTRGGARRRIARRRAGNQPSICSRAPMDEL